MKKKNLQSLKLNKKPISNLESLNEINGGAKNGALPKSFFIIDCPSYVLLCR